MAGDFFRVYAAIGIERYDNIPRTVNESFAQRVTFAPRPDCQTTRTDGGHKRATSLVASRERPSTTITS